MVDHNASVSLGMVGLGRMGANLSRRWGQSAFDEFKVVPPGTGIVHQVNIENLAATNWSRHSPH